MANFLFSFLASILGTLFVIFISPIVSKKARWLLTSTMGRFLGIDVEYVFKNAADAESDIIDELQKSPYADVMTFRGNSIQRDTFSPIVQNKLKKLRVLLPHTNLPKPLTDWVRHRDDEISEFDGPLGDGVLRQQIEVTEKFLRDKENVEVKYFTMPPIARIILTDKVAYYTPYRSDLHGRHSPIIKYRRGHMYDSFRRLFDQLWKMEPQDFSKIKFLEDKESNDFLSADG